MPLNYAPLIAEWPNVTGANALAKLATLNEMMVAGPMQDVSVGAVEGYLDLNGLSVAIQNWIATKPSASTALTAATELMEIIGSPHISVFQMSQPGVYAAVEGFLNALAANPPALLSTQNVSDLLALAVSQVPWWQANGYPVALSTNDLAAAELS